MTRTRQEIFDTAWNGLAAQGFVQSRDADGACLFRGPNGLKCAIGHCIPDSNYHKRMDSDGRYWDAAFEAAGIGPDDRRFAENIQTAHDNADHPQDMKRRLKSVAEQYGIAIPA